MSLVGTCGGHHRQLSGRLEWKPVGRRESPTLVRHHSKPAVQHRCRTPPPTRRNPRYLPPDSTQRTRVTTHHQKMRRREEPLQHTLDGVAAAEQNGARAECCRSRRRWNAPDRWSRRAGPLDPPPTRQQSSSPPITSARRAAVARRPPRRGYTVSDTNCHDPWPPVRSSRRREWQHSKIGGDLDTE